jgi:lipid-binding SYLF domain-containing protein
MTLTMRIAALLLFLAVPLAPASAAEDKYAETIKVFKNAGESAQYFKSAYGYAVFPTIGKGGLVVGGAAGKGRVYVGGKHVGNAEFGQISVGFQAGGQAYSMIVFLEDERAFKEFTSGTFKFGADASAVAITAGASAGVGTTGTSAGASAGKHDASTAGSYYKGMATFTVAKGGLMYEASIAGGGFKYEPL